MAKLRREGGLGFVEDIDLLSGLEKTTLMSPPNVRFGPVKLTKIVVSESTLSFGEGYRWRMYSTTNKQNTREMQKETPFKSLKLTIVSLVL